MIGRIDRVPLRGVWSHEAFQFTPWLERNIDVLNDVLDTELSGAETEQSAGSFDVDLLAEDESGEPVVIENQFGKSDHDHLGKLLTYFTAFEAKRAIWIVETPRPEHVRAVTWLNETQNASFYLLKMEAVCIGDSDPAPLLTMIVGPSEESREVGKKKEEWSERGKLRYRFREDLLELCNEKTRLFANIAPKRYGYIGTGAGKTGLAFNYCVTQNKTRAELYIDRGSQEENDMIFRELYTSKDEIEREYGGELSWERLEGKKSCRIAKRIDRGGYRSDEEHWPAIHERMIDSMVRLQSALRPHIAGLSV